MITDHKEYPPIDRKGGPFASLAVKLSFAFYVVWTLHKSRMHSRTRQGPSVFTCSLSEQILDDQSLPCILGLIAVDRVADLISVSVKNIGAGPAIVLKLL